MGQNQKADTNMYIHRLIRTLLLLGRTSFLFGVGGIFRLSVKVTTANETHEFAKVGWFFGMEFFRLVQCGLFKIAKLTSVLLIVFLFVGSVCVSEFIWGRKMGSHIRKNNALL